MSTSSISHFRLTRDDRERRQRLPDLQFVILAQLAAKAHNATDDSNVVFKLGIDQGRIHLWEVAPVNTGRRRRSDRDHQALIDFLGDERHERRQDLGESHQHLVQRGVGIRLVARVVALPETGAR